MRKAVLQEDLFRNPIVELAIQNKQYFPDDFIKWLKDNIHVWNAFDREALKVITHGHKHYGAKTIFEFLRHHSATREIANGSEWKLNNNYPSYLARLFALARPAHKNLFEFRVTRKVRSGPFEV